MVPCSSNFPHKTIAKHPHTKKAFTRKEDQNNKPKSKTNSEEPPPESSDEAVDIRSQRRLFQGIVEATESISASESEKGVEEPLFFHNYAIAF